MRVRDETVGDADGIDAVTRSAFADAAHSSHTEHLIVRALRAAGALSVSLVAEDGSAIIGHVAISPVTIIDLLDQPVTRWYGLGPISVLPDRQGQGVGSQLMAQALRQLRERGAAGCVLLGDPGYYQRFGFQAESVLQLPGVPPAYFMALPFEGAVPQGVVQYHAAFAATA